MKAGAKIDLNTGIGAWEGPGIGAEGIV